MSHECVVAVYESLRSAKKAVSALENAAFSADDVSLVARHQKDALPKDEALQFGDKTENRAAAGAGMGGLIGALLGTPLIAVASLGSIVLAGPIAVGLAGALVGGFLGAMSGWGVHDDHIQQYERQVAEGDILVIASGDPQQVSEAEKILKQSDATDVHRHAKTSADEVEP